MCASCMGSFFVGAQRLAWLSLGRQDARGDPTILLSYCTLSHRGLQQSQRVLFPFGLLQLVFVLDKILLS